MKDWKSKGYQVEITGDGSPTLRLAGEAPTERPPESMHHSGGAAAETKYIYGKTLESISDQNLPLHVVVVGLGLGYIELLSAYEYLKKPTSDFSMLSFEKDVFLIDEFLKFLRGADQAPEISQTYHSVLSSLCPAASHCEIKATLLKMFDQGKWRVEGELKLPFQPREKFNVIQYDAFSSKTDNHLWDEKFLIGFLQAFAADTCAFATYACMGNLKRALKHENFSLEIRPGFQGKRDSTFALRKP